jgi:predicted unusual protein kinase regulating ubiquinone biosynthesis (AarF/ABC1/UbiB family)
LNLLAPEFLTRRLAIARLLAKYGRRDLVHVLDIDQANLEEEAEPDGHDPEELAHDLEGMGAVFVKAGQLLSTRPDLLSAPYIEALRRLQDGVEPFAFEEVQRIVEEELSVRISSAYSRFDERPLGAGSLAQVHRAALRDGREVVVKIQRPGIREQVIFDLEALAGLIEFAQQHIDAARQLAMRDTFEDFRRTMLRELDFEQEARSLKRIGKDMQPYELLLVPQPIADLSSSRVITMDYVDGTNVSQLTSLARLELDGSELALQLVRGFLDQVLVHGVFAADPHPGNLLVTRDGRLALIDMGMVAYVTPHTRDSLMRLLLAIGEGNSDTVTDITIRMGERLEAFDETGLRRDVGNLLLPHQGGAIGELNLGRVVMETTALCMRHGLRPSPDIALLGKTLLNLDEAVRTLSPDFQPTEAIQEHAGGLMWRHLRRSLSPGAIFNTALEANQLVQRLPGRLNALLDSAAAGNGLQVHVRMSEQERFLGSIQKIANRITAGIIIAALIVGAALLTRSGTGFELFGYPGLALILFLLAATAGFALVIDIMLGVRGGSKDK